MLGLPAPASTIVPVIIGSAEDALKASVTLEEAGFLVSAIRPPTVPNGTSRLRFSFTAAHHSQDIEKLAKVIKTALGNYLPLSTTLVFSS
jgi:8-amino-7-oxononanoate synthase